MLHLLTLTVAFQTDIYGTCTHLKVLRLHVLRPALSAGEWQQDQHRLSTVTYARNALPCCEIQFNSTSDITFYHNNTYTCIPAC